MPWTELAPPAAPAVSLSDLKDHLRLTSNDEDGLVAFYAQAASQVFEAKTRRRLIQRQFRWEQPDFPGVEDDLGIELPFGPVQAAGLVVQYYGTAGSLQTLAGTDYYLDATRLLPRVVLLPFRTFPAVQDDRPNGVQVTFTAGYGPTYQSVPEGMRWAVMLLAAHMYTTRTPVGAAALADVPKTLGYAVDAYKIWGA
ncbi:MAG: phage head-tail connector protein [Gemmataceae bacterium]|nr:phage head-tail connector protein [Gemmataceae bacterium]